MLQNSASFVRISEAGIGFADDEEKATIAAGGLGYLFFSAALNPLNNFGSVKRWFGHTFAKVDSFLKQNSSAVLSALPLPLCAANLGQPSSSFAPARFQLIKFNESALALPGNSDFLGLDRKLETSSHFKPTSGGLEM
eukprot:s376_g15.t1